MRSSSDVRSGYPAVRSGPKKFSIPPNSCGRAFKESGTSSSTLVKGTSGPLMPPPASGARDMNSPGIGAEEVVRQPAGALWPVPAGPGRPAVSTPRDRTRIFLPWADRIRECGAEDRRWVFVDSPRPGRRRWCAMGRCGNRHKIRELRIRRESHRH
ncbi:CGNR zinc finger domain-containing protein [Nocardiopsis sp. MT53]|uniref:CGNR zinc finger domain-containing protein n=2 Tax=Nocardiopsidaceae TaxID=83676 RepID=A0ABX8BUX5_9ACTN|nr:CGNR zinc finger domain-containing protein [Nocardiopsis changdeensis]QYX40192.1 CGNR zinc finger domain-containing protein [Nocardiopsis sp. MT53]